MKRILLTLFLALVLMAPFGSSTAIAAPNQTITVNATPAFITISSNVSAYDFGVVSASVNYSSLNAYFGITNSSTVPIDVNIQSNGWVGGVGWSYGAPAADTGNLDASSLFGGAGGSSGQGNFDKSIPNGSDVLIMDAVGTANTSLHWELQLDSPTSFTFGDEQQTTLTVTGSAN